MANITFSSPSMARDVTVYAVAGDRGTILAIAKANKIPIPFDCQDGECGSCLIEVKHLDSLAKHAIALTEKEKEMLKQLGKITKAEIADAEVNDLPPRHRLACQCFVRHEDVLVTFEGDKTLPTAPLQASPAARRYKGGLTITSAADFSAYAAAIESDAAVHFDDLAKAMTASKADEIATLFSQLADQSRQQAAEAKAQAGGGDISRQVPDDYLWPHYTTPESDSLWAADASLSRLDALKAALIGERRCYEFYCAVEATAHAAEVARAARPFIKAEGERVKVLEAWITREEWSAHH